MRKATRIATNQLPPLTLLKEAMPSVYLLESEPKDVGIKNGYD